MIETTTTIAGMTLPLRVANTIIGGAGAAGMNCAVRLVEFFRAKGVTNPHEKVLVVTGGLALGASRMSGSDKQTYYKMGTSPRVPDTAEDFAKALTSFGCCHGDTALVEGICSLRGFYHLVEAGVPFPHDPCGAFIGYKTDHDPYERATSAGPKTSKFMAEHLEARARRKGLAIIDRQQVVDFVTVGEAEQRQIAGMVCVDPTQVENEAMGLTVYVAANWVLAGGGPGEIYQATVYPPRQRGIHGPGFKAGLVACNLTESQYGLASIKFRWNVSGTYMQAVPRIYSTDADSRDEREFLTEYFDDLPAMATNIFLKGYQWPFDAQRITGHQSSLIDMAVHQETVDRGRRVWMDFLQNPVGKSGWGPFELESLGPEALDYLRKTGALHATPIERLAHMNPPAIEIYAEHNIDLHREPLEIAVCAQHHNGGFAVGKWWESSVRHVFVIGEMAGTHGVKRPGGSALNAGQVGGLRAAEYIANVYGPDGPDAQAVSGRAKQGLTDIVARLARLLESNQAGAVNPRQAMDQIARRMTQFGAHLRSRRGAAEALSQGREQYRQLVSGGLAVGSRRDLPDALAALQQCLTHVAMLKAICGMFDRRAGSRGSHCILDEEGIEMHPALIDPQTHKPYRFRPENESLRENVLSIRYAPDTEELFELWDESVRPIPDRQIAFEPAWAEFRSSKIYLDGTPNGASKA